MKILRVRRGFTTNSSASSEWVPPAWRPNSLPPSLSQKDGSPSATGTSSSGATGSGGSPGTNPAATTQIAGTNSQTRAEIPAATPPGAAANSNLTANTLTTGLLIGGVILLFGAERLARRMFQKSRAGGTDEH